MTSNAWTITLKNVKFHCNKENYNICYVQRKILLLTQTNDFCNIVQEKKNEKFDIPSV